MLLQTEPSSSNPTAISASDWKTLFEAIKGSEPIQFDVEETADEIVLIADPANAEKLQRQLAKAFSSPEAFKANLAYQVNNRAASVPTVATTAIPSMPENNVQAHVAILQNMFGAQHKRTKVRFEDLFDEQDGATVKAGVLCSSITTDTSVMPIWRAMLEHLILYFNGVDIEAVRRAWMGERPLQPPSNNPITKEGELQGVAKGLAQECFMIVQDKVNNKLQLVVDLARLYSLVFPPKLELYDGRDGTMRLRINKKHMISFLQRLMQGEPNVIFRVFRDRHAADQFNLMPIFFERAATVPKPRLYVLMMDKSGSMHNDFDMLKKQLKEFLQHLLTVDPDAEVSLVFFSTNTEQAYTRPLKQIRELFSYIDTQTAQGCTRLYGTMRDMLDNVAQGKTIDKNVTLVLFTDGVDEGSDVVNSDPIKEKISTIERKGIRAPKIFTLGMGKSYDANLLAQLAQVYGNAFVPLDQMSAFTSQISKHIRTMQVETDMVKFVAKLRGSQRAFRIPVQLDNSIQVPNIILPLHQGEVLPIELTRGGNTQSYSLSIMDASRVEPASEMDTLRAIHSELHNLMANDQVTVVAKRDGLNRLSGELNGLQVTSQSAQRLQTEIKGYVAEYKDQLARAQTDQLSAATLGALAASRQRAMPVQDPAPAAAASSSSSYTPPRSYNP